MIRLFSNRFRQKVRLKAVILVMGILFLFATTGWNLYQALLWDAPVNISFTSTESLAPTLAADSTGTLHVIWAEDSQLNGRSGNSLIYSSLSQGLWSNPIDIVYTSGEISSSPSMDVDEQDILHLVWLGGFSDRLVYSQVVAVNAGSAKNWSSPTIISPITNLVGQPDLAVGNDGTLQVIYPVLAGELSGIYYISSLDNGISWSSPNYAYLNDVSGRMVTNSRMAVDENGGIHAVWTETPYPETFPPIGIRYTHSFDGGLTWSRPRNIDGPYDMADILAIGENEVHVVWSGTLENRHKFHFFSSDRGDTWSAPVVTIDTGGYQGRPGLAADSQNTVHLVQVSNAPGTILESLFHQSFQNQRWSLPERLVERDANAPFHPIDPNITVGLGNQIHVAVPVSIQNRSGGWAYDILYFHAESSAPPIEPEAQVPAATPTAEGSEAETAPAATSSPAAAPTNLSPVSGSEDMQEVGSNPLWIGIVPVVVLIVVVFVFQQSRRKQ
ncbi:MAG: hypothetical protein A2Z16_17470 [Chloroflexi bacterium RBG_16_54_18]|nr:MAG: hypothetical protein A2Z16_17470 [Chloroflexi bacterium RBG_16_54_18]